ncbi:MAG: hypothetical protein JWL97_3514, partial [Gemmatimonadales bacterium]|nr:hypothetical protein [Gemmatimonadales bacterium]
ATVEQDGVDGHVPLLNPQGQTWDGTDPRAPMSAAETAARGGEVTTDGALAYRPNRSGGYDVTRPGDPTWEATPYGQVHKIDGGWRWYTDGGAHSPGVFRSRDAAAQSLVARRTGPGPGGPKPIVESAPLPDGYQRIESTDMKVGDVIVWPADVVASGDGVANTRWSQPMEITSVEPMDNTVYFRYRKVGNRSRRTTDLALPDYMLPLGIGRLSRASDKPADRPAQDTTPSEASPLPEPPFAAPQDWANPPTLQYTPHGDGKGGYDVALPGDGNAPAVNVGQVTRFVHPSDGSLGPWLWRLPNGKDGMRTYATREEAAQRMARAFAAGAWSDYNAQQRRNQNVQPDSGTAPAAPAPVRRPGSGGIPGAQARNASAAQWQAEQGLTDSDMKHVRNHASYEATRRVMQLLRADGPRDWKPMMSEDGLGSVAYSASLDRVATVDQDGVDGYVPLLRPDGRTWADTRPAGPDLPPETATPRKEFVFSKHPDGGFTVTGPADDPVWGDQPYGRVFKPFSRRSDWEWELPNGKRSGQASFSTRQAAAEHLSVRRTMYREDGADDSLSGPPPVGYTQADVKDLPPGTAVVFPKSMRKGANGPIVDAWSDPVTIDSVETYSHGGSNVRYRDLHGNQGSTLLTGDHAAAGVAMSMTPLPEPVQTPGVLNAPINDRGDVLASLAAYGVLTDPKVMYQQRLRILNAARDIGAVDAVPRQWRVDSLETRLSLMGDTSPLKFAGHTIYRRQQQEGQYGRRSLRFWDIAGLDLGGDLRTDRVALAGWLIDEEDKQHRPPVPAAEVKPGDVIAVPGPQGPIVGEVEKTSAAAGHVFTTVRDADDRRTAVGHAPGEKVSRPPVTVRERVTYPPARDIGVGERVIMSGDSDAVTVTAVTPGDGDDLTWDVRRDDGTEETVFMDRGMAVSRVPADNLDGEPAVSVDADTGGKETPASKVARPRRSSPKRKPDGAPSGRPPLHTYQRRNLNALGLDDDGHDEAVQQAAARVRARRTLTADQASALAEAIRTEAKADGVKPVRRRSLERLALQLDALHHQLTGLPEPDHQMGRDKPEKARAANLGPGDTIALPHEGGTVFARVQDVRAKMRGRLVEVTVQH